MKLHISTRNEILFHLALFIISCFNSGLIYLYLIIVFFEILKGSEGFIKMCILFTIRQIFYLPGLASSINKSQIFFKLFLYTIAAIIEIVKEDKFRSKIAINEGRWIVLFGVLAGISSVLFGSYPIAGLIKVISFTTVFYALFLAITRTAKEFDCLGYLYYVMSLVMLTSFILIPYPGAYLLGSSGLLFRGVWNHPNDFGVACSIYIAIVLVKNTRIGIKELISIAISFYMIYISQSRGAMIAATMIIIVYPFICDSQLNRQRVLFTIIILIIFILFVPSVRNMIHSFFNKGAGTGNYSDSPFGSFMSRETIFNVAIWRFKSSPLFGRGLLITYEPGHFHLGLYDGGYEPGTIFLELLAGTGIVGTFVFFAMMNSYFRYASGRYRLLLVTAIFSSISEVSFFSVNNYACLYYIIIICGIISPYLIDNKNTV